MLIVSEQASERAPSRRSFRDPATDNDVDEDDDDGDGDDDDEDDDDEDAEDDAVGETQRVRATRRQPGSP